MSWFKSYKLKTKEALQNIETLSIQNRIDGEPDIYQEATTINNYFQEYRRSGKSDNHGVELHDEYEFIDADDITNMTDEDWAIYGSHDNWCNGVVSEDSFNKDLKLIAEYGSYKNLKNGISIEEKASKRSWFGGVKKSIAIEANIANKARQALRELDEEKRERETRRFKKDADRQAEIIAKQEEANRVAYGMRHISENKISQQLTEAVESLKQIASTQREVAYAQPQISAKSVADELMQSFRGRQMQNESIIDTKILTR